VIVENWFWPPLLACMLIRKVPVGVEFVVTMVSVEVNGGFAV
jgi:hypothetical protein